MLRIFCVILFLFASQAAYATSTTTPTSLTKTQVIVDTDVGCDDAMALVSLLLKPTVEVKAITISGTGLAHVKEGMRNIHCLLRLMDKSSIPIAGGRELPFKGGHLFPASWRTEHEAILDDFIIESDDVLDPGLPTAVELIRTTIESSKEKITILALGPLTNIAEAFRMYPHLIKRIEKIHIMGGAVDVPGNLEVIDGNKVAEWNIFADPCAAQEVFQTQIPIQLIALDVTSQTAPAREFYEYVEKNQKTAAAQLFFQLLKKVKYLIYRDGGGFDFWDVVAVEILVDPTLAHFENRPIEIVTEKGPLCGQTAPCSRGCVVQLATKLDRQRFFQTCFDTVNSPP